MIRFFAQQTEPLNAGQPFETTNVEAAENFVLEEIRRGFFKPDYEVTLFEWKGKWEQVSSLMLSKAKS